jgi:hypothetical protein
MIAFMASALRKSRNVASTAFFQQATGMLRISINPSAENVRSTNSAARWVNPPAATISSRRRLSA